jgi:DNA topoisomerase-1
MRKRRRSAVSRQAMTTLSRLRERGIRRIGTPRRGFRYRRADGRPVSAAVRRRIEALRVPPAWRDARIAPSSGAKVQAVGLDRAGRWQYLYHARQARRRERARARRLTAFVLALPRMRAAVRRDLRRAGLPREKVLACTLRILSTCFLRPGSAVYAGENGSFGIATLRRRHVRVRGDVVTFAFAGKGGKPQHRELRDRTVARVVRQMLAAPRAEVFQFETEAGEWVDVRRRHITDYVKDVMGERFTAKDFRTWAGTLVCASALARGGAPATASSAAQRREIAAALRETAAALGNTPAVCRSSYVAQAVLDGYARGAVLEPHFGTIAALRSAPARAQARVERALLALLSGNRDAKRRTVSTRRKRA